MNNLNIDEFQNVNLDKIIKMKLECPDRQFVYLHSDGQLYYGDIFKDFPSLVVSYGCRSQTEREAIKEIESLQAIRGVQAFQN